MKFYLDVFKQFLRQKKAEVSASLPELLAIIIFVGGVTFLFLSFLYLIGYIGAFLHNIFFDPDIWIYPFYYDILYSDENWFRDQAKPPIPALGVSIFYSIVIYAVITGIVYLFLLWIVDNWRTAKRVISKNRLTK